MLDISWGELLVVTGLGFALIGKKDLPHAAGYAGNRLGRIVGLLQGARARADTFAQQSELQQLHAELRSGLRELDAVKSEMAVAMSSPRNIQMNNMHSRTVLRHPSAQPQPSPAATAQTSIQQPPPSTSIQTTATEGSSMSIPSTSSAPPTSPRPLPPKSQTIAAVAEEEWEKQGIGFRSRAERGVGWQQIGNSSEESPSLLNYSSGSSILANLHQQILIFDQYDQVIQEQDELLQSKIQTVQAKRRQQQQAQPKSDANSETTEDDDATTKPQDKKE